LRLDTSQQELSTPMFSRKYKVRRNDTTATTDLGSTLSAPERVASATRFVSCPCPDGFQRSPGTHFNHGGESTMSIWTILFVVLLIAWLGGFTIFHVAGGMIHLLLVFAVISLILHFVLGPRAA
jgi:Family of unknown function (DUF5670)